MRPGRIPANGIPPVPRRCGSGAPCQSSPRQPHEPGAFQQAGRALPVLCLARAAANATAERAVRMTNGGHWRLVKVRGADGLDVEARQFQYDPEELRLRDIEAKRVAASTQLFNVRAKVQLALCFAGPGSASAEGVSLAVMASSWRYASLSCWSTRRMRAAAKAAQRPQEPQELTSSPC